MKVYIVSFRDDNSDSDYYEAMKVYRSYEKACREAIADYKKMYPRNFKEYLKYTLSTEKDCHEALFTYGDLGDIISITEVDYFE